MSNIDEVNELRKAAYTGGEWSRHSMTDDKPRLVKAPGGKEWFHADVVIGSGYKVIAEVKYSTAKAGYPSVDSHSEFLANASLLLAAPDLLEALQAVLKNFDPYATPGTDENVSAYEMGERAIAKALGQ